MLSQSGVTMFKEPVSASSKWWLPIITLWHRELVRFFRQKSRLIGALATPLMFWLFIGSGLQSSFRPPLDNGGTSISNYASQTAGYLSYFFPGTIAMILLFTSIFANISLIQDRNEGFLQSVLVAPIPGSSLVMGKILGGTTVAVLQGLLFLIFAPLAGISITFQSVLWLTIVMFVISIALSSLGFVFAWMVNSIQGFHGIMNLVLLPMWLMSGAFFPRSGAVQWVRWIMTVNPLTYGVSALRLSFNPSGSIFIMLTDLLIMAVFALAAFVSSVVVIKQGRN